MIYKLIKSLSPIVVICSLAHACMETNNIVFNSANGPRLKEETIPIPNQSIARSQLTNEEARNFLKKAKEEGIKPKDMAKELDVSVSTIDRFIKRTTQSSAKILTALNNKLYENPMLWGIRLEITGETPLKI